MANGNSSVLIRFDTLSIRILYFNNADIRNKKKKIVKRTLIFALEKKEWNGETKCKWFGFKSSIDKTGELTCFSHKRPNSCHCQYLTWLNDGDCVPALHKSRARTTLNTFHLINGPLPSRYCRNTRVIKSNNFKS